MLLGKIIIKNENYNYDYNDNDNDHDDDDDDEVLVEWHLQVRVTLSFQTHMDQFHIDKINHVLAISFIFQKYFCEEEPNLV